MFLSKFNKPQIFLICWGLGFNQVHGSDSVSFSSSSSGFWGSRSLRERGGAVAAAAQRPLQVSAGRAVPVLAGWLTAASAPQEAPRRGQEVSQGLRGGAPGALVHRLPLEEGVPALHRLRLRPPASVGLSPSSISVVWKQPLRLISMETTNSICFSAGDRRSNVDKNAVKQHQLYLNTFLRFL